MPYTRFDNNSLFHRRRRNFRPRQHPSVRHQHIFIDDQFTFGQVQFKVLGLIHGQTDTRKTAIVIQIEKTTPLR